MNSHLPSRRNLAARLVQRLQHTITALKVRITNVHGKTHLGWNTVDCTRKNIAKPDCRHSIGRSARSSRLFDGQYQFRSRTQGISPLRHQDSSRMSSGPFHQHAQTCRGCNSLDHTQPLPLLLEEGALLDMQLHKCLIVAVWQSYLMQVTGQACLAASVV